MKMPEEVKIGSQIYKVIERSADIDGGLSDALAYTLVETNAIVVKAGLPKQRQQAVLMHEIIHAMIYTFTRQDRIEKNDNFDDWEHYFIGIVQEPLIMVMKDNPQLVKYLTQK